MVDSLGNEIHELLKAVGLLSGLLEFLVSITPISLGFEEADSLLSTAALELRVDFIRERAALGDQQFRPIKGQKAIHTARIIVAEDVQ